MRHINMRVSGTRARGLESDQTQPVPWIGATEGVKSDGYDLKASEWDLSRFERYGPVLWAHDYVGTRRPSAPARPGSTRRGC